MIDGKIKVVEFLSIFYKPFFVSSSFLYFQFSSLPLNIFAIFFSNIISMKFLFFFYFFYRQQYKPSFQLKENLKSYLLNQMSQKCIQKY